jgi:UDP-3-O-[3-hydroxymyristoyl] glucosamine N-acyltransferase
MSFNIEEILKRKGFYFTVKGDNVAVDNCASILKAKRTDLTFCYYQDDKAVEYISKSDAGAILCNVSVENRVNAKPGQQLYFTLNPRLAFVEILTVVTAGHRVEATISPFSFLDPSSKVGDSCSIGEFSVIGKKVSLNNCIIGDNCNIQSGTTIGEDGFAYERTDSNNLIHFPHLGKVIIEDFVDIGANCSIARGSLSDTIIETGTKLDAMVHIAHNVSIGKDSELTAGAIVGGSTIIGKSVWLGLNSTLKDNIRIGDNVIVGAGAMVISNIPNGDIVAGVPAKSIKHKVNTNMKFLMAGQTNDFTESKNNNG